MDEAICAVLTPPGRGAIATVAVAGQGARALVERVFQSASKRALAEYAPGSIVFGRFRSGESFEELVVGLPETGLVEVHCHGGQAAVGAVCDALVAGGARLVDALSFMRLREPDATRAAAAMALGAARTAPAAAILLDQCRGALSEALQNIVRLLERHDVEAAKVSIEALVARSELGLRLTTPWRVVLAGPPNAGKSSLMNALLGYARSIVFAEPGTTRDVLSALSAIDGWPVELIDTAGLREASDALEAEGVSRARRELGRADLALFVSDLSAEWDQELFAEVCGAVRRAPLARLPLILVVGNKVDLAQVGAAGKLPAPPIGIRVSALTGEGIEELCRRIGETLVPEPPRPGEAVPFTAEQVQVLQEVLRLLAAGEVRQALWQLVPLVGNCSERA